MWDPKKIGGSSAAAALGLGAWESRLQLWERLTGKGMAERWARDMKRRLEAGKAWERIVQPWIEQDYEDIVLWDEGPPDYYHSVHPEEPRIVCHPDGETSLGWHLVEIKLTGRREGWGEPDTDEIPPQYLLQCLQALALDKDWEDVWVFVSFWPDPSPVRYLVRRTERARAVMQHMLDAERRLLDLVDSGTPPDPLTEEEARRLWHRAVPKKQVAMTSELSLALVRRHIISKVESALRRAKDKINLTILEAAKDAEQIVDPTDGSVVATLRNNRRFNEEKFKRCFPKHAEQCMVFDPALAKEHWPQGYERCMDDGGPRVIRTTKAMRAATARMIAESNMIPGLPLVPEVEAEFAKENDSE